MDEKYQMEYALHFCNALKTLEERLRDTEDSQALINGFLQAATEFFDADRAYIIEADWIENIGISSYEWCKKGVEYKSDTVQYWEIEHFPRWTAAFKKNDLFYYCQKTIYIGSFVVFGDHIMCKVFY